MSLIDKMGGMDPLTGRQVAGRVVHTLIPARGWKYQDAAVHMMVTRQALNKIMRGDPVKNWQLRRVERGLDLPLLLLDYIIEGDVATIRQLEMRPDARELVLTLLQTAIKSENNQRRRNGDR